MGYDLNEAIARIQAYLDECDHIDEADFDPDCVASGTVGDLRLVLEAARRSS